MIQLDILELLARPIDASHAAAILGKRGADHRIRAWITKRDRRAQQIRAEIGLPPSPALERAR